MPSALILIANGTEEMEFTIAYDTLTRAGIECTSAFVFSKDETIISDPIATCSRGVRILSDTTLPLVLSEGHLYDALVIPGGAKGADTLSNNASVQALTKSYYDEMKVVGMICAGSLTAKLSGIPRQPITSHPSVKSQLEIDYDYKEDSCVVSGNLITSRGPGTAFEFSLKLVEILCGEAKRKEVEDPMVFPK